MVHGNSASLDRWWQDKGDTTRCIEYPLSENSVVYDVGGYKGDWASSIIEKYSPYVYIFEPIEEFFSVCKDRFKDKPKVCVLRCGLSNHNADATITVEFDRSSTYTTGDSNETITMRDVSEVITSPIDLVSINIEGGEYALLLRMLDTGVIKLCKYIQVQFHDFYPNCDILRDEIRKRLSESHVELYCYPFVWESWKLSV